MRRMRQRSTRGSAVATQAKLAAFSPQTTQFFVYLSTLKGQLTFCQENKSGEYQSRLADRTE